jgi:hypothetical protein
MIEEIAELRLAQEDGGLPQYLPPVVRRVKAALSSSPRGSAAACTSMRRRDDITFAFKYLSSRVSRAASVIKPFHTSRGQGRSLSVPLELITRPTPRELLMPC